MIADLLGFTDLEIPGEDQRTKQAVEIIELIKGMPVVVDPLVDDHAVHIETIRHFCVGQRGLNLKKTNPQGYQLLEQHLQMHSQIMAQQQMQAQMQAQGQQPPAKPNGPPQPPAGVQ
jgi:hypothetical protein